MEYENGHLASISSRAEMNWLNEKVGIVSKNKGVQKLWLGGTDQRVYGVYEWSDGTPFHDNVAPWVSGHPRGAGNWPYEMCVSMASEREGADWKDEDCYNSMGYVCKSDSKCFFVSFD